MQCNGHVLECYVDTGDSSVRLAIFDATTVISRSSVLRDWGRSVCAQQCAQNSWTTFYAGESGGRCLERLRWNSTEDQCKVEAGKSHNESADLSDFAGYLACLDGRGRH